MIHFKQFIIGNKISIVLMSGRNAINLLRAAYTLPESLGTIANDQLATLLVTNLCQSNKIFIDVGAHIGSIISLIKQKDSSIKIIGIEAIPEKATKLKEKFPSVTIHDCAVGSEEGNVSFFINTKQSGYSSLIQQNSDPTSQIKEIKVDVKRLDDLITSKDILNNVDVIKIDVEGSELGVLRGSNNLIKESRPLIMFESASKDRIDLGFTKKALWEFLSERNYEIYIPNRVAHNGYGLSQEGFIESHIYPRRTTNYFAIPEERRLEVRDRAREILGIK